MNNSIIIALEWLEKEGFSYTLHKEVVQRPKHTHTIHLHNIAAFMHFAEIANYDILDVPAFLESDRTFVVTYDQIQFLMVCDYNEQMSVEDWMRKVNEKLDPNKEPADMSGASNSKDR